MPVTKDVFTRGFQFDGTTGLHTGEQLEDLVTRATPADGSEMVDQVTLETYLDDILNVYRVRVKDGSITGAKLADGAITNAKLAEGFTMVKSVQRGVVSVPNGLSTVVVTLATAVDPAKSILFAGGTSYADSAKPPASLTNSTTLTFYNWITTGAGFKIEWQLLEFI